MLVFGCSGWDVSLIKGWYQCGRWDRESLLLVTCWPCYCSLNILADGKSCTMTMHVMIPLEMLCKHASWSVVSEGKCENNMERGAT